MDKTLGERDFLFERSWSEYRATNGKATLEETPKLDGALHSTEEAEADKATSIRERAEVLFKVSGADEIDDEVDSALPCRVEGREELARLCEEATDAKLRGSL